MMVAFTPYDRTHTYKRATWKRRSEWFLDTYNPATSASGYGGSRDFRVGGTHPKAKLNSVFLVVEPSKIIFLI